MPLVVPGRRIEAARGLARRVRPPREVASDLHPDGASPVARWKKNSVAAAVQPRVAKTTGQPTIAVVIPTYQRRDAVIEAVRSVLEQDASADEVIVVDDGSTDGTADALEAVFGASIRVLRQANRGPSAARNEGIRQAQSKVIAFQDSDNRWLPHHLGLVHDLLAHHPDAALVATSDSYQFGTDTATDARRRDLAEALLLERADVAYLTTIACPRALLQEIGGFDEQLRFGEDVDLFIRLALHGPFVTVRASTMQLGVHADSLHAAGRAQGLHADFMTRSAANALAEIARPSAIVTDAALHAAMARRAIAEILTRLEAGASAAELRPLVDDAVRWQPEFATSRHWIVRQIDAANRDRGDRARHREMLATIDETWRLMGARS
jgi:glycosyltransferase involved in cell wall biosynthesis